MWNLWSHAGSIYLQLDGKGTATRWYRVTGTTAAPVMIGVTQKGTWKKIEEEPAVTSCAAILCAVGTTCVDGPDGGKCVATDPPPASGCMLAKCTADTVCEDTTGSAICRPAVCPTTSSINCMPIVPEDRAYLCSGQFHEWIKENCTTTFTY